MLTGTWISLIFSAVLPTLASAAFLRYAKRSGLDRLRSEYIENLQGLADSWKDKYEQKAQDAEELRADNRALLRQNMALQDALADCRKGHSTP